MSNQENRVLKKSYYRAIIISPHLDDAVFSCGGAIAKMATEGPVLVLNIFTRYLSEVKLNGISLNQNRHQEDLDAAKFLGFESRNLDELDVVFRREEYKKLGNIFRPPVADDINWLPILREKIFSVLAELDFQQIYVPLGIGWHVDHILTHLVFEPWRDRSHLIYYEEAPYCQIPNSTRYRLNDIATYPIETNDLTLVAKNEFFAWINSAQAYSQTALMKNLKPWLFRIFAIPVVSFYLFRQMADHRKLAKQKSLIKLELKPIITLITEQFERKVDAMTLYRSQFKEFFCSREDCTTSLMNYSENIQKDFLNPIIVERYWVANNSPKQSEL